MNGFEVGQEFEYAGLRYRVIKGDRCDGDMIIQFRCDGWHQPAIAHTLILAAFKYQVEENNYGGDGKIVRGKGGWKLLGAIRDACVMGDWRAVAESIKQERLAREKRNNNIQLEVP